MTAIGQACRIWLAGGVAALTTLGSAYASTDTIDDYERMDASVSVALIKNWPDPSTPDEAIKALDRHVSLELVGALAQSSLSAADRPRLTALWISRALRDAYGQGLLVTERSELWNTSACKQDLSASRFPSRIALAASKKLDHEVLLTLVEFQNGLNCLSARQAVQFAHAFGRSIVRAEHSFKLSTQDRLSLFNLALLTVDQTKFAGRTPLYEWLKRHAAELKDAQRLTGRPLYLYDYVTGQLVGISGAPLQALGIERILKPEAIGMGACSFLEMEASGLKTGNYGCSRSLGCGDSNGEGKTRESWSSSLFNGSEMRDRMLRDIEAAKRGKTPMGVSVSKAQSASCGGAGSAGSAMGAGGLSDGSGSGAGGIGLGRLANGNWQGCVTATTIATAVGSSYGQCVVGTGKRAQRAAQSGGSYGPGKVSGVGGGNGCTDPLAQRGSGTVGEDGHGSYDSQDSDNTDNKEALAQAKKNAAAWLRSAAGQRYVQSVVEITLQEYRADVNSNANLTDAQRTARLNDINRVALDVRRNPGKYADHAAKAIESAGIDDTLVEKEDALAQTEQTAGNTPKVTIDTSAHVNRSQLEATLAHEGGHVAKMLAGSTMTNKVYEDEYSEKDEHTVIQAWEKSGGEIGDWFWIRNSADRATQAKYNKRACSADAECAKRRELEAAGTGNTQMPEGPQNCSPLQAAMMDMLSCANPSAAADPLGRDSAGGSGTGGGASVAPGLVLPSVDQWNNAQKNVFSQCLAAYGVGTPGLDGNGYLSVGLDNPASATGCGAMLCPAGGSSAAVGGGCACGSKAGDIARLLGPASWCFNSDACLGGQPERFVIDPSRSNLLVQPGGFEFRGELGLSTQRQVIDVPALPPRY